MAVDRSPFNLVSSTRLHSTDTYAYVHPPAHLQVENNNKEEKKEKKKKEKEKGKRKRKKEKGNRYILGKCPEMCYIRAAQAHRFCPRMASGVMQATLSIF